MRQFGWLTGRNVAYRLEHMFEQVGTPAGSPPPAPLPEDDWVGCFEDREPPSWLDAPVSDATDHDWLFGSVADRLRWVLARRPSAVTLAALEVIAQAPMTATERVLFAQACDRQASASQGLAIAALGEAAGDEPTEDEPDLMAVELGLALHVSPESMRNRVHLARRLRDALPCMLEKLCAGQTSWAHVRIVDDLTIGRGAELTRRVDALAAPRAVTRNATSFRAFVRSLVARLDVRDTEERHRQARKERRVAVEPAPDGMAWLNVLMTATDAIAAVDLLNRGADAIRVPDDARTHGERQVEWLLGRVFGTTTPGAGGAGAGDDDRPATPRPRAEVQVVVDLQVLLGLRDGIAELPGYGSLPISAVHELLGRDGSMIRRLVTDPVTGLLVDYARTRYRPDAHLTGLLDARDRTCRFPGCTRRASTCDKDHRRPWDEGGATSSANLHSLCRRHHRLKTLHRYRYDYDDTSRSTAWTTPLGFTYRNRPAAYTYPDPPPD